MESSGSGHVSVAANLAAMMAAAELGLEPDSAADELLAISKRMGIDLDSFGHDRSSRQVIDDHNRALRDSIQELSTGTRGGYLSWSNNLNLKPVEQFLRPPAFGALATITCADLQLNTTHRQVMKHD
jgi:hypothetical protein